MSANDDLDRRLIVATQAGLPLVPRPYHALAEQLGTTADEVMVRMNAMEQFNLTVQLYLSDCFYYF